MGSMLGDDRLRRPIRVALLIDRYVQERWVYKIVQDIVSSSVAEIVLIIKNE